MAKLNVGVIGVGSLGQHHARNFSEIKEVCLAGVADADVARAQEIAAKHKVTAYSDYHELLQNVDAVSVVVPTSLHHAVARDVIAGGKHLLLEKPITSTIAQAEEVVRLAGEKKIKLQVGHIERFNPALRAAAPHIHDPKFIECTRIAPYVTRGTDVPVVLDLMIHDIDIILSFVRSEVERISAIGFNPVSDQEDIANARLEFANGCVANVTASRISIKKERKVRFFQRNAYINVDYMKPDVKVYKLKGDPKGVLDLAKMVDYTEPRIDKVEPLKAELTAFVDCILHDTEPLVTGGDGLRALKVAEAILEDIAKRKTKLGKL
ncbi:MAG TPA: Gfo/Idh/MocA family oxidoreductase [Candidatus Edwardsbacteria bacterium]|nr:Gfo/Idh/MocA family oxidoreductase [Candidatus Edwardsbacteria bacterium]